MIFIALFICGHTAVFAFTPFGTTIESQAEIYYDSGYASSEVISTIIEDMYGITIEPTGYISSEVAGNKHYFPHLLKNLGNNTDNVRFHYVAPTTETWGYTLIEDTDQDGQHDVTETTTQENPMPIAEEAIRYFFVTVSIPATEDAGASREVHLVATSEVMDGGYYIGADGLVYGGPDTAEVTDVLTAESGIIYVNNIFITREGDSAGSNILLSWNLSPEGGPVDIYTTLETFTTTASAWVLEPQFTDISGTATTDAVVKVGDGVTKWYKIVPHDTSLTSDMLTMEVLGKFDVRCEVGNSLVSLPIITFNTDIKMCIGRQITSGDATTADKVWYYDNSRGWQYAYIRSLNGAWAGALKTIDVDKGYYIVVSEANLPKHITFVGKISTTERQIALYQDPLLGGLNMVGSCFPVSSSLNDTELKNILTPGDGQTADRVWYYGALTGWKFSYLRTGRIFTTGIRYLDPGKGYWINKQYNGMEIWNYYKPY